ncbi:MAG TPA: iron-containing alcohol dehydrogenase [Opitutaceae bacterium]|nr:iron-containing alcohol dehydrogenase [Opitutaceae bacterium]
MRFEFATAGRIIFGAGALAEIPAFVRDLGRRPLVVTGRDPRRAERLLALLASAGVAPHIFAVAQEPSIDDVNRGTAEGRSAECDCVIGFGGGSALDAGKAIAALLTNGGELLDYLEVVGRAQPLPRPAAPYLAIPTTAGTGSEVTRNAVLGSPAHRVKVSLRSPHLLPRVALVDPDLTHALPPALTAATGLDALTQLIEPYVSPRANPFTDALATDGIRRVARSLQRAVDEPQHAAAREDMALGSMFGGLALANAGLGAVHGFANPLGGMFPAPHGAVCGALLPPVMEINLRALRARDGSGETVRRYDEVARLLTGRPQAQADDGVRWVRALVIAAKVPALGTYGFTRADLPAVCDAAAKASSMKANPVLLTRGELEEILERAT